MDKLFLHLHAQKIRVKTLSSYKNRSWKKIEIKENNDPLILIPSEFCYPFYFKEMKITDDDRIFLRSSVFQMFLLANEIMKKNGLRLLIYDGWRPLKLQENLFWFYLKKFTANKFNLQNDFSHAKSPVEIKNIFNSFPITTQEVLKEANKTYVSWPSSDKYSPSPHSTGGSVDVWVYNDGHPLNLGIPFDWMEENAGAFYHLKLFRKRYHGNEKKICFSRNLLIYSMVKAGFSCYGPEIWHFNYGNQMDSLVKGGIAQYSYIEP